MFGATPATRASPFELSSFVCATFLQETSARAPSSPVRLRRTVPDAPTTARAVPHFLLLSGDAGSDEARNTSVSTFLVGFAFSAPGAHVLYAAKYELTAVLRRYTRAILFLAGLAAALCIAEADVDARTARRDAVATLLPIVQTWTIAHKLINHGGIEKLVAVVNGQYPGPELRGRAGQRVIVTVINAMPL